MAEEAKEKPLSDEEMRKLLKPVPKPEDMLKILQASYASSSTGKSSSCRVVQQLDSYDDCNFKVEIDSKLYLLKVHNGLESRDFLKIYKAAGEDYYKKGYASSVIHFQNAIIDTLAQNAIPTSAVVPPNNGSSPVLIETLPVMSEPHSPTPLVVKLMEWLPGRPMSSVKLLPLEVLADAGRTLGRVDAALDRLRPDLPLDKIRRAEIVEYCRKSMSWGTMLHDDRDGDGTDQNSKKKTATPDASIMTAARRFHQWDGQHTAELREFTHCIEDEKRRGLVESVIDAFCNQLQNTPFRWGINHGDFNDANIMVDQDFAVSGVLDFGDSVESWRVLDVSVAMAYAMLSSYGKENRSISAAAALLRGYNSVYPLTDKERSHLVLLIACRLSCSVTLGAFSFQQNPTNKYLLLHAEPAWKALEMLWGYDAEKRRAMTNAVDRVFQQACLYSDSRSKIVTCYDLLIPDPAVADLLQSVRVPSTCDDASVKAGDGKLDAMETPKKRKMDDGGDVSSNGKKVVITFVTGNAKKLEEVKRILGMEGDSTLPYKLANMKIDIPELQGEALNVAREKATLAAEEVGSAVIVEDTSLCFSALNGMPGVFIKWFLDSCGHEGLNQLLAGYTDKSAYAQTVVAFSPGPGQEPIMFDGRTTGKIVMPRGSLDFGWDPIFEPDEGGGKTYAEMAKEEKDAISHRSRAFQQLSEYLHKFQTDILTKMEKN